MICFSCNDDLALFCPPPGGTMEDLGVGMKEEEFDWDGLVDLEF